jgi:hypothetical protein
MMQARRQRPVPRTTRSDETSLGRCNAMGQHNMDRRFHGCQLAAGRKYRGAYS